MCLSTDLIYYNGGENWFISPGRSRTSSLADWFDVLLSSALRILLISNVYVGTVSSQTKQTELVDLFIIFY